MASYQNERTAIRDKINSNLERIGLHRLLLSNLLEHVDSTASIEIVSKQLDMTLRYINGPDRTLTFQNREPYVYVLALDDDCWYVGLSQSVSDRIACHFNGSGAQWTKLHRPKYIQSIIPGNKDSEKETTLQYMRTKGWQTVRGGAWCSVTMTKPPHCL